MYFIAFAGLISGMIMSLIGIGGGAFLVPLLLFSGLNLQQTVAIVLITQAIPASIPGLIMYYKNGVFPWREGIVVSIGSLVGIVIGAYIANAGIFSVKVMYRAISFSLLVLSIFIWWKYC